MIGEEERHAFVEALVETAWDPERRTVVLIALRADFFGHLAPYVELADLVGAHQVLLGPLTTAELRRAIEGPAERTGLEVEPALVDALVDDVAGEPGGLPLLSTALVDVWREREGSTLTLAAYERSGGVRGAVGRHADAAFRSLRDDEQQVARRILLRLVTGGGARRSRDGVSAAPSSTPTVTSRSRACWRFWSNGGSSWPTTGASSSCTRRSSSSGRG